MRYLLNSREAEVLQQLDLDYAHMFYRNPAEDMDLYYHLGDSARWRCWSAVSQKIPTFRKSSGKTLHRATMTCMSGADKLAALGWPVTKEAAESMGTSPLPCRDAKRASELAGNAMHLTNASIVMLTGLACFDPLKGGCRT